VGPRTGLRDVGKRKFLTLPGLKLRPLVGQPVASRYADYATPASMNMSMLDIIMPSLSSVDATMLYCA
jgi:hypothetical protein